MTEASYPVPAEWAKDALIDAAAYDRMYAEAATDPDTFWAREAKRLDWIVPPTKIKDTSFEEGNFHIRWFEDGQLNVAANCVDRHATTRPDATAILWEGDDPADARAITYAELRDEVSRLANALKARGVAKGDRVTIYMPMIPEAAFAMLACARIGAIHSVVFGGFSPEIATAGSSSPRTRVCAAARPSRSRPMSTRRSATEISRSTPSSSVAVPVAP
jgi:acetyl-CoA synthetase